MEWLSSNWIWLVLGIGAFAYFAFRRGGGGMGHGGHSHGRRGEGPTSGRAHEAIASPPLASASARLDDDALEPSDHTHGTRSANEGVLAREHAGHGHASTSDQTATRRHRHGC